MSILSKPFDPDVGPTALVRVSPQGDPTRSLEIPMLLDTGADGCCLAEPVVSALNLLPVARIKVHNTSGGGSQLVYAIDISIALDDGNWSASGIPITPIKDYRNARVRGLIGRNVLREFDFLVYRNNTFQLRGL